MLDLAAHFSRFRAAAPERINLACHSHHDWPDVTLAAQERCWMDAARLAGDKWRLVFGELMPQVQAHLARHLRLPDPATIAFAPNTHEFLRRLLSCFPADRPVRILTSDGEFHTARRQLDRLGEDGVVTLTRVPAEPLATFAERFQATCAGGGHDLVFVSQVFFNSGGTCGDLASLAAALPSPDTYLVIDGYHGFMARPTDLSGVASRAFYLAGGYKYAMAGEGACFLHCPPGHGVRPRDTGWFADFGALAAPAGKTVGYPVDAGRFLGATFDPSGLYRMAAVFDWLAAEGITACDAHGHAQALMARFLDRIAPRAIAGLGRADLITPFGGDAAHGNFLTFRTARAGEIESCLAAVGVHCDHRGDRLRFGFGLCTTADDVDRALVRIGDALAA
ncbi:aminotransferase class V-fold PLP-dependent enzyme [Bradyrhizobium sp. U87765 SZCCT0131]|nr:aminotransferase class V-fold PLP-dependent enzyme [Bradyrhizobium sp. U87765 SZCCT0131]MBR1260800.1 aminotransferase class V-fold PLP-dependent enzyme [Bradyrhizobium sp. U87765 SZCCT0134]MBR1303752.1 aminotransferase class V-fold PLP-dependent enzyme [Bradyrhizobium sp. U87765 SZCCT0110]MBR1319358.1 aminotransferase class V-fold PLP-dependent enzyme [Bradyrhizobium sp. U87765 SZCCT0109]MBR1347683.1 aminotransferase class V-fold PLP-dependent enzyme [Bradyrhizobium sp. U87765 SZCCT0048]